MLSICLNPFGTGQCLTTLMSLTEAERNAVSQSLWNRAVSYDNLDRRRTRIFKLGLNPFGTGQCLTTNETNPNFIISIVSIPLEQGSVLRRWLGAWRRANVGSQSLWNRAVSYDCSGVIKPCATRLTEATSQLFPRLRELGLGLVKC